MDYDHKFKLLLTLFFCEFLELFFPDFARQIDWSRPVEFLDKELRSIVTETSPKVVDLLVRVETLTGPRYCLIHVEVEGRKSRRALGKRLHRYFNRLDELFDLPIVPIAVFLHVGGQGLGWQSRELICFGHCFNHFEFPYLGLPALDGAQYVESENPLAWALAGLMNVPPAERARIKAESLRRVERQRLVSKKRAVLVQCVEAFTVLSTEQKRAFEALIQTDEYRKARDMQKTIYDEAEEKGLEQGLEKGREQGREQGRLQEGRRLLLIQLEEKFGPLSDRSRRKIDHLTLDEIDRLARRVVTANDRRELGI
jgi:hypothetical protein